MNLITILILISAGTILILFEIFLLPGLIVGLIGVGLCAWGIYEAFTTLGSNIGWIIMIITIIVNGVLAFIAYKNLYKSRFSMKEQITSRVNEFDDFGLLVGEEGTTITDLRPEGKALYNNKIIPVWTFDGGFISSNQTIKIVKISDNKIFVNHLNN